MWYRTSQFLSPPHGNAGIGNQKLLIPPLQHGSFEKARISQDPRFVAEGVSYKGLEALLWWKKGEKTYTVVDNHNHTLALRHRCTDPQKSYICLHIDQHTDMNTPKLSWKKRKQTYNSASVDSFVNEVLTIADFLLPAKEMGILQDIYQIQTEYGLFHHQEILSHIPGSVSIILDIDVDFRAPSMSITNIPQTYRIIRDLISLPQTAMVSFATSPYFIDQQKALEIIADILYLS